jgi:hypothetical protein
VLYGVPDAETIGKSKKVPGRLPPNLKSVYIANARKKLVPAVVIVCGISKSIGKER